MAAGDGDCTHADLPHPKIPCVVGPCNASWENQLPNHPTHVAGQVDAPSSYAIAGKVLLAAAGALSGILLALVALHLYNSARRRHFPHRRRLLRSLAISGGADEERDGAAAQSPRGLDPAVLRVLPVVAAGAGAGDCAVCLAEFEPGEKARELPRCGHQFHVECIDAWFRANTTCPLCRADVEAPDLDDAATNEAQPEVRINVAGDSAAAAKGRAPAPAMGRLPSGTDLEKTRQIFASTRSASI